MAQLPPPTLALALRRADRSDTQGVQAQASLFAEVHLLLLFGINILLNRGGLGLACECGKSNGFAELGIGLLWGQKPSPWFAQVRW